MAKKFILASLMVIGLSGCGPPPIDKPPAIRYGTSRCDECGMIISEERFSAAAYEDQGELSLFDDIGCLPLFYQKRNIAPVRVWVHDSQSLAWIDGKTAYFVMSDETPSPMGYNITAYASKNAGEEFVKTHHGQIESYDALMERDFLSKLLLKREPLMRGEKSL